MEKISAQFGIVVMLIAVCCAFPGPPCSTDADCHGEDVKCIDGPGATKKCAYCLCLQTDQCEVINGNGNGKGKGNAYGPNKPPIATCNCNIPNTVQPICEPTCAYSPYPCGTNTVCDDNDGTVAANCSCETGYEGNPNEGCTAICEEDCDPNGSCYTYTNGSFYCVCNDGYFGDGECCTATAECGGDLTGETGSLSFPSAPDTQYCNYLDCSWTLTTTSAKVLRLKFTRFDIETASHGCWDTLLIRDGAGPSAPLINYYDSDQCGYDLPDDILSSGDELYFQFRSDVSNTYTGFAFDWTSELP